MDNPMVSRKRNYPAISVGIAFLTILLAACATPAPIPIAAYEQPQSALVLIDFQKDFLSPSGKMPVEPKQAQSALENANRLIAWANDKGFLIVIIGSEFKKTDWLNAFRNNAAIEDSAGALLDERLTGADSSAYFPKTESDAFSNPDLGKYLIASKVDQLYIAGMYAEYCVYYSTEAAVRRNYKTIVASDGLASRTDADLAKSLKKYARLGTRIATTNELIAER